MADYEERPIDGPPAYFPAGKVYRHAGGHSTHLNIIMDAPNGDGYIVTPLLVPGQKDVGRLLRGERPTQEQVDAAMEYARQQGTTTYPTVKDAQAAEALWRKTMIPRIEEYIQRSEQGPP